MSVKGAGTAAAAVGQPQRAAAGRGAHGAAAGALRRARRPRLRARPVGGRGRFRRAERGAVGCDKAGQGCGLARGGEGRVGR